jgi:hypothetical protein
MNTLNAIAYNILNKMRGGRSSNNDLFSLEQIKYNIEVYRSLLLRRDMINSRDLRDFEQQILVNDLPQIPTVSVGVDSNLNAVRKIDLQIPKPLRVKNQIALNIAIDGYEKGIPVIPYQYHYYQDFNRFTPNDARAFFLDNTIYFTADVATVQVRGVFEEPRKVMELNGIDPDYTSDQPYPISYDIIQQITEAMLRGDFTTILQTQNESTIKP